MIRQGMYNGFDWYGRILEVREVGFTPYWCLGT
jgi:hypothetical protein